MKKFSGVIYIITNPSFPEYVKIGYADDFQKRLNSLNGSSATPFAFRAYAVYDTDIKLSDKEIHKLIDGLNPNLRSIDNFDGKKRIREFYAMSPEDAYQIFVSIAKISGTLDRLHLLTPDGKQIEEEQQAEEIKEENNIKKDQIKRRPNFKFSFVNLKEGNILTFKKDNSITCKIISDDKVEYNGEQYALSMLTDKLIGGFHDGARRWEYNGKLLKKVRDNNETF